MLFTVTYVFKFEGQTKRQVLKGGARIAKWFFNRFGKNVKVNQSLFENKTVRRKMRRISVLKSPFIHKKAWEHFGSPHFLGESSITFTADFSTRKLSERDQRLFKLLDSIIFKTFRHERFSRRIRIC